MAQAIGEWLHLALRWMHIVAGILWIGSSMFFNWLNTHLEPPEPDERERKPGVEGGLWMIHGGGFYQVEKRVLAPDKVPRTLHWFIWEAAFTWLTGIFLLTLVYDMGGGSMLVDPSVASISPRLATVLGIAGIAAAWLVYELVWTLPPLAARPGLASAVSVALAAAAAFGLAQVLSGRAAYMHVGAILGTCMVANVWFRIIPNQRELVAATREGRPPSEALAKQAKARSLHNNYMTYPLIFIMVSNHFPGTYASHWNWAILLGVAALGAAVRHLENRRDLSPMVPLGALGVAAVVAAGIAFGGGGGGRSKAEDDARFQAALSLPKRPAHVGGPHAGASVAGVDPATAGAVRGVVRFEGRAPEREELALSIECAAAHREGGPVLREDAIVVDGRLANAFVWIEEGLASFRAPPSRGEAVLDQRGCVFAPHVVGVEAGQPLLVLNSDPINHNVHSLSVKNPFRSTNMAKDERSVHIIEHPEIMVEAKCDLHTWMVAYVGVVPHPYFAVTGTDGAFVLERVPPGEYVVAAWHEVYGRRSARSKVSPQGTAEVELVFSAAD